MPTKIQPEPRRVTMGVTVKANLGNYESMDFTVHIDGFTGDEKNLCEYLRQQVHALAGTFVDGLTLSKEGPKSAGQVALALQIPF